MQEGGGRTTPTPHPSPHPLTPTPSLYGTLLYRREKTERWQGELGVQAEALSTLYFLWVESKVSLPGLIAPPPSFQPPLLTSSLPHFLLSFLSGTVMSLLPPCCGVTDQQRLLLAASPVDSVVMSLTPGSTIGHPRPPQWAASLVYSVGEWGGEPRRDGETVFNAEPPRSAPLHAPAEVNDCGLVKTKTVQKLPTLLTCQTPSPSLLCHSAPTDNFQTDAISKVRTTTKDARFNPTGITHRRPCNKLNYNRSNPIVPHQQVHNQNTSLRRIDYVARRNIIEIR